MGGFQARAVQACFSAPVLQSVNQLHPLHFARLERQSLPTTGFVYYDQGLSASMVEDSVLGDAFVRGGPYSI